MAQGHRIIGLMHYPRHVTYGYIRRDPNNRTEYTKFRDFAHDDPRLARIGFALNLVLLDRKSDQLVEIEPSSLGNFGFYIITEPK